MYSIDDKKYPCSTSLTMRYIGGKKHEGLTVKSALSNQNRTKIFNISVV